MTHCFSRRSYYGNRSKYSRGLAIIWKVSWPVQIKEVGDSGLALAGIAMTERYKVRGARDGAEAE